MSGYADLSPKYMRGSQARLQAENAPPVFRFKQAEKRVETGVKGGIVKDIGKQEVWLISGTQPSIQAAGNGKPA
jgi:hypothetical protein